jgi:hypothetical protein
LAEDTGNAAVGTLNAHLLPRRSSSVMVARMQMA